jgi:hypothetical protein
MMEKRQTIVRKGSSLMKIANSFKPGKMAMAGLLAATLAVLNVNASPCVSIRLACPNDLAVSPVKVHLTESDGTVWGGWTDDLGIVQFCGLRIGETYTICVVESTLPPGASIKKPCQDITILSFAPPIVEFVVEGDFCGETPPGGDCWLTGGGTVDKTKGQPTYSFGGVVYPGCSPKAAEGGNWNVVDHATGLHFQGQQIIVDSCSGVSTRSPRVNVNIIDFHGTGIIGGIGGNPEATIPVTFVGRAIDNLESGGGNDKLYISVSDGSNIVLQIGTSAAAPATISTGNLQIHTTSCDK